MSKRTLVASQPFPAISIMGYTYDLPAGRYAISEADEDSKGRPTLLIESPADREPGFVVYPDAPGLSIEAAESHRCTVGTTTADPFYPGYPGYIAECDTCGDLGPARVDPRDATAIANRHETERGFER